MPTAPKAQTRQPGAFDWRVVAHAACMHAEWQKIAETALGSALLADLVTGALRTIGQRLEEEMRVDVRTTPATARTIEESENISAAEKAKPTENIPPTKIVEADPQVVRAAGLLGVALDATEDRIRAALRTLLASSRLHPDQGGDADKAKRFIAAKNLLIERARWARVNQNAAS
jgi:hypothetical protein